jgi:mycofactocin system glycosyltransferase
MIAPSTTRLERRYRLESNIRLYQSEIGGRQAAFIYSTAPLFVTKTSPQTLELLQACDGQLAVSEIAPRLRLKPASVLKALEELRSRGIVQVTYAQLIGEAALPSVSVVVPVYNRPAELVHCLEALLKLEYPRSKLEIMVVDDASTDDTAEVAARYPVKLVRNSQQIGPAGSRNRAIELARHELIACVDSDCVVAPDWLRRLAAVFVEDEQVAAAGGATRAVHVGSLLQRYEDVRSSLFMGEQSLEVRLPQRLSYLPTCNLIFRREIFQAIGGFDPALRFGEDVDFCWRLLKAGWKIQYLPAACLGHAYRNDWRGFLKTRVDYASSEAPLVSRHPDKRRAFYLPLRPALAWAGLLGVLGWRKPWLLLLSLAMLWWGSFQKWRNLRDYKLPLRFEEIFLSEIRSCGAAGYHLGIHLGKYYSLPLLIGLLTRRGRRPVALVLAGPVLADYLWLKPRLNFPVFFALSLLENLFYQLGVALGCLRQKRLTALLPKFRIQRG